MRGMGGGGMDDLPEPEDEPADSDDEDAELPDLESSGQ